MAKAKILVDMDNCLNSDHRIGIRAKTAIEEVNRLRGWIQTGDVIGARRFCADHFLFGKQL
jgi:hypothetical protein